MAISREEARDIGRETAKKVIKSAEACPCGIAAWDTQTNIHSIEAGISHQQSTWVLPDIGLLGRVLKVVEEDCGISVSEAREIAKRIDDSVEKRDWEEARRNLILLKSSIWSSLKEGSTELPSYLTIRGKKHKLVGTEPDEAKANIWAANMEKSGEKIIIVPLKEGYSLYREE